MKLTWKPMAGVWPEAVQMDVREEERGDGIAAYAIEVHNTGVTAVDLDIFSPALTGLVQADVTVYVPCHGGAVLPVRDADFTIHNLGGLTVPAAILHRPDGDGVVIAQEKTPEDEGRYRTGLFIHGKGWPARACETEVKGVAGSLVETARRAEVREDLGGVAAFIESVRLAPGETLRLGPYLVGSYRGTWLDGAALLKRIRRPRPLHPWPAWFRPVRNVSAVCMWHRTIERFSDYPAFAEKERQVGSSVVIPVQWNWLPRRDPRFWWAYSIHQPADEHLGGDVELRRAIAEARKRGVRTLLYTSFCTVGTDGPLAKLFLDKQWHMLCEPGRTDPAVEYGGCGYFLPPCLGLPEVRRWVVEGLVDLMRRYEPDGLFVDEAAAIGYRCCYNPAHQHAHPHVWTAGMVDIFREFRRVQPAAVVLLEGSSELLREYVDGFICHSHSFTGQRHRAPVTRAIVEGMGLFDSAHNAPVPGCGAAYHFAGGALYCPDRVHGDAVRRHQKYRLAYPELFEGEMLPLLPRFESPQLPGCTYSPVVGYLLQHGGRTVLTVANTGAEVSEQFVTVTLPLPARGLYDRVTARFVELDERASARLTLEAFEVLAFEVIAPD